MKMQTFVFTTILLLSSYHSHAIRIVSCSDIDSKYILSILKSKKLEPSLAIERDFSRADLKGNEVCELRNEIMSDGLSFTLYKLKSEKVRYISVDNGFDGSYKTYGPFEN